MNALKSGGRWADLLPRVLSAIVMIAIGGLSAWAGGIVFALLIALSCGGMLWELTRMLAPRRDLLALGLGGLGAGAAFVSFFLPLPLALILLALPAFVGLRMVQSDKQRRFGVFALWIMLAGLGFVWMRNELGLPWILWLIGLVVATDVAGYFAGKIFGGPKLWPRLSPKKTWSGAIAGWIGAAVVGAIFATTTPYGVGLVLLSVGMSMASQAGDIAESALKRSAGIKDSSALIPGHGGLLDRFDGMLGAAVVFMLLIFLL